MYFRFGRVSQPALAASLFVVFSSIALAQAGQTRTWKDRQEYDIFSKISQTSDAKTRLELLNSWQDKYLQSDVAALRLKYYVATLAVLAQTTPSERQPLLDKCRELLTQDRKDVNALYQISLWGPVVGGSSPTSELQSEVNAAARDFLIEADAAFARENKPAEISDADFAKVKSFRLSVAHNALAWVAAIKGDLATAETEYKASLTVNPEQGTTAAQYAKLLYDQKRYPEALFQYGRAAQYTGPGPALPPTTRSQLMDFFTKIYREFHGMADGADQVLALARASALTPANFSISSAADAAKKEADELKTRLASDPAFGLWYTIRQNLTGDQADSFFEKNVKDTLIPGGANGIRTFSGTVISVDLGEGSGKVRLGSAEVLSRNIADKRMLRRGSSFPRRTNGCEFFGRLLERKDETASAWPFRSNRFGNWLGLHEYWHC